MPVLKSIIGMVTALVLCFSATAQSNQGISLKNKSVYCIKIVEKDTKTVSAFVFKDWPNVTPIYRIVFDEGNRYSKFKGDGSVAISGTYSIVKNKIILKSNSITMTYTIVNQTNLPFITLSNKELDREYLQYCIIG